MIRAGAAHAGVMAALHAAAFSAADRWSAGHFAAQFGLPGLFGYLSETGGLVLARHVADEAEILTLAVIPQARRTGLGRALLSAAMAEAARHGAATMFLEVSVGNAAARALYDGAGFVEIGRRPHYYADGSDAVALRRMLSLSGSAAS